MNTDAEILIQMLADIERMRAKAQRLLAALAPRTQNTDENFTADWLLKSYGMRREAD